MTWNHISKLFYDDVDCGLHLVQKLTNDHINLSSFSVMNVRLAAQVLSESVSSYYFGRQRSLGHRKDNPSLRDIGYNDNTIRTTKLFQPITGNCYNDDSMKLKE